MRQPSMVIHKGRKEEKYEIYVEDYVISFLKERADNPDVPEILFYGRRDRGGRQYTIYGAGQDRHLAVFDKYDLLEEISCRITQADPVFLIKETTGIYEVKGYKVFYYENEEMQDYLIHRNREAHKKTSFRNMNPAAVSAVGRKINPHYAISLQMGIVFIVLVAIVINSANSYDKMEQLNQSAAEVFFVMENQEADEAVDKEKERERNDIVVERSAPQDNILRDNVLMENKQLGQSVETAAGQAEESQTDAEGVRKDADGRSEEDDPDEQQAEDGAADTAEMQMEKELQGAAEGVEEGEENGEQGTEESKENEGIEALSRNVARYYEVERGDTLYLISQKIYGDTTHVKKICEINQIADPDNIRYGQKIILP